MPDRIKIGSKYAWRCPANIALVKYWGKQGNQLPCNASVSMTLSASYTEVDLEIKEKKNSQDIKVEYTFDGKQNEAFEKRIVDYLKKNISSFPSLDQVSVKLNSRNSFPHSAGIASSASSFGAIALAFYDAFGTIKYATHPADFIQEASCLARLGSGSASRSLFPGYSLWGANSAIKASSDRYATALPQIHANFKHMEDTILVIDENPKKIPSSMGHALMEGHPFAKARFTQANNRTVEMVKILASGDMNRFIHITESEAFTLHALMMSSNEPCLLIQPKTLEVISRIQAFRNKKKIPVCFTLDAGPNIHLLYPSPVKDLVFPFIETIAKDLGSKIIRDSIGTGPVKLK